MKSSIFLVAASALLATASPLRKRVMETKWVEEVITVTVTDEIKPTAVYIQNFPSEVTSTPVSQSTAKAPLPSTWTRKHWHKPTVYLPPASKPKPTTSQAPTPPPAPKPKPTIQSPPPAPKPQSTQAPPPPAPKPSVIQPPSVEKQPPSPKPQPSPDTGSDYQSTLLHHHNIHRANHSAPPLEWDDTLAQYAKNTATGCVFKHDMNQGTGGYGQNLASWGSTGDISGLQIKTAAQGVTMQWYDDEMENWSYYGLENPPAGSNLELYGHFTQVVWKSSTKLGCYTANCPAGAVLGLPSWYTVCNYNPPGNFGGQYGKNVLKPLGNPMVTV